MAIMASLSLSHFRLNTSSQFSPPPNLNPTPPRRAGVWCCSKHGGENTSPMKFDRRNLLLSMGGLYGGANIFSPDSAAFATPISSPDLSKCTTGTNLNTSEPLEDNCCPPLSQIVDYKLPPVAKLRVRPAAHLVTKEYIAKYEKATQLMKALPADDPRSFTQQANVHCAYCNLTYEQNGDSSMRIQIHNSWLFYPWHRWYLYFYERILGELIDDPTFALPFWNWDNPNGMIMPEMYARKDSSLYDERRNQDHLPPAVPELYFSAQPAADPSNIVPNNLAEMYSEMVRVTKLEDFYGAKYVTGTAPDPGAGSVERGSHSAIHAWVGDPRSPSGEDMGNFYTVGRDPVFFAHHTNVDRMWSVWRSLRGSNKPKDFTEPDWLESNFLFYDEHAQLVRVTVRDTLEEERMGFTYQKVDLPWLNKRPTARVNKSKVAATSAAPNAAEAMVFPVKLEKVVKVMVDRPKRKRSKKEKVEEEELLVIEGIEVDTGKFLRFDVYVNDEDDKAEQLIDKAEYAGCYSLVPHKNSMKVKSKIRLGLTELLEDLDAEDDDKILVSLVPRAGGENITIGGVKIIFA